MYSLVFACICQCSVCSVCSFVFGVCSVQIFIFQFYSYLKSDKNSFYIKLCMNTSSLHNFLYVFTVCSVCSV
ncbi:hypothetical protein GLOIN_2v821945 [Rhizophagus irregularis DAOM 181602=DAOM 197198]|uniref:Uncharacterized protein n=1 Tax=Rhizophagus irregularis (strain DAOM 181602 / DAOM 197198 / MUCL 43194) TaxID=747089 RepID=A0A2P4QHH8_RHIID|nr:hypothetical protein GLOIN_2v821945 [Rhizophagus irregularis DAOM 181602=DAOM 197198]POG77105.1 hypothetical protein GLOIN_2v821945 [Rhizophagus irregularis DAOM 181602=DAOM 197198]GET62437.1 hypothetical protein GLOIN_2v821945 [Rhizophagus irregularis DAOM 181602=DAOM 197198]|eukprot:XP_025183971.1 hypothetical protein GLOIN_2v821945 [Rhizophagus irregularis DAOM 181602=DAOM 197198]